MACRERLLWTNFWKNPNYAFYLLRIIMLLSLFCMKTWRTSVEAMLPLHSVANVVLSVGHSKEHRATMSSLLRKHSLRILKVGQHVKIFKETMEAFCTSGSVCEYFFGDQQRILNFPDCEHKAMHILNNIWVFLSLATHPAVRISSPMFLIDEHWQYRQCGLRSTNNTSTRFGLKLNESFHRWDW